VAAREPDYPWYSAELGSHQAALAKVAARMRDMVRAAEAQRIRYLPPPIITTEDDLAALGDVF
jgi:hypothetical protein